MEIAIDYIIGDVVKIKKPAEEMDVEDYYYLLNYQGKKGTIVKIEGEDKKYYHVVFGSELGVFYREDLIYLL